MQLRLSFATCKSGMRTDVSHGMNARDYLKSAAILANYRRYWAKQTNYPANKATKKQSHDTKAGRFLFVCCSTLTFDCHFFTGCDHGNNRQRKQEGAQFQRFAKNCCGTEQGQERLYQLHLTHARNAA